MLGANTLWCLLLKINSILLQVFRLNTQPGLISMYETVNKIRISAIPNRDRAMLVTILH